jgi:hypothetical protein
MKKTIETQKIQILRLLDDKGYLQMICSKQQSKLARQM